MNIRTRHQALCRSNDGKVRHCRRPVVETLNDGKMAGLGKLYCGALRAGEGPVSAVRADQSEGLLMVRTAPPHVGPKPLSVKHVFERLHCYSRS